MRCKNVREKRTYTVNGDEESGSFKHVCHRLPSRPTGRYRIDRSAFIISRPSKLA